MKSKLVPFFWSGLVMAIATWLALHIASRQKIYVEAHQISSPDVTLTPVTAYFLGSIALLAIVLFFVPIRRLRLLFRLLFALVYAWGVFVVVALFVQTPHTYALLAGAGVVALAAGALWLVLARVWIHNLLLLLTLAATGSVFGFFFSPWTFMVFMLLIAVYDLLAVRFGFMVWMAEKLSQATVLPAFIFPKELPDWRAHLDTVNVGDLAKTTTEKREYTILGGGDIGFPLMLTVSVFFATNMAGAFLVAGFALAGLIGAFLIQLMWLKNRPVPALPPIAALSLVGLLLGQAMLG